MLRQRGGSCPFIKDLVPGIISPDTMDALMEFLLVSGHGATDPKRLMVVPENTFVMFLGQSAFMREIWDRAEQFSRLVSARGYIPEVQAIKADNAAMMKRWAAAQEQRKADLYKSFITGESEEFKFYKGATIYCPGDILPETRISFHSGVQNVWNKGVYSLPVSNNEYTNFTEWTNPVFTLVELIQNGVAEPAFIEARLKPEKREEFRGFLNETYESWLKRYPKTTYLSEFFEKPEELEHIFDEIFYTEREGNLAAAAKIPVGGEPLSELLGKFPAGKKPYRVFIVTSCRGPLHVAGQADVEFGHELQGLGAANFPPQLSAVAQRKFLRRASISSKCATDQGKPAMNLLALRKSFYRFVTTPDVGKFLGAEPIGAIVSYLQVHFFVGPDLQFPSHIPVQILAILLAYAYMNELPEIPAFKALVEEIRDSFGEFTRLLRREAPFPTKGMTIEQILLKYADLDDLAPPFLSNAAAIQRSIRGEKEMYKPKYAKEVAAFQKEMDAVLKKGRDGLEILEEGAKESAENGKGVLKTLDASQIPEFQRQLEGVIMRLKDSFRWVQDTIEAEQERVFFAYRFLKQRDKDYRMEDSMNLIEALDSWPKLVKPLEALLHSVGAGWQAGGGKSKRRNITRRLRRGV